jgi:hypothetical protein
MTSLPQLHEGRRPDRLRLAEHTPAVLRLQDGTCTTGDLQIVSLSGGLLGMSMPLRPSAPVKLLFVSGAGPILGTAEMLDPITRSQQPFRFVSLGVEDLCKLQTTIQSALYPRNDEDDWIQKYRAAISRVEPPQRNFSPIWWGAATLALLSTASALFLLHAHWLK